MASLGIIDLDGVLRCRQDAQGIGQSFADRSYFQDALSAGKFVIGLYTKSRITGKGVLPMAMPLGGSDGKFVGVVALSMDLDWLQKALVERSFDEGAALTIADREGFILARHPLPERFIGTRIPERYRYLVTEPKPGLIELTSQDGTRRLLAYSPVSSQPEGLYVSTGLSVDSAYADIRKAITYGVVTTVLALLLALVMAWHTIRNAIQRPVERITGALHAWRDGNEDVRTGMSDTEDEFGLIGAAFDQFMNQIAAARQERQLLEAERTHRIKNILAMVQAVATQTFREDRISRDSVKIYANRLNAIGDAFTLLGQDHEPATDFRSLLERATLPFDNPDHPQFDIVGATFVVKAKAALAFSMALHELATNAVKYGALRHPEGKVLITWAADVTGAPPAFDFRWEERDGPPVMPPTRKGFGSNMIEKVLAYEVSAKVQMDYAATGLVCVATAPLIAVADAGKSPQDE